MTLTFEEKLALREKNDEESIKLRHVVALEEIADTLKEIRNALKSSRV